MSFNNLYYKRTAGTAKACYVCFKPTTTVLATINTVDFLYTCPGHLTDSGFASIVKEEGKVVNAEEIARIKAEYEEKQKKKAEKEKEKAKEKEKEKDDDKDKEKEKKDEDKTKKEASKSPAPASPNPAPTTPSHERYILHRDFFAMRQAEHRKRRQTTQAKDLAPRLPSAPRADV